MSTPDWASLRSTNFTRWSPRSELVLPRTPVGRSAVPAIDVHNHLGRWLNEGEWMFERPADLIDVLDESNVELVVNLDGFWGDELVANLERYDRAFPSRIATFCWVEWGRLAEPDGVSQLKKTLKESADLGARGVKVWKELGLKIRDRDGRLILPDDERVIEVLGYAGELGLPVLIHVSDPKAYFAPADVYNERLDELVESPDMWVGDRTKYPTFYRLIDALETLVLATPGTRYVAAHVGCASEDLERVETMLDNASNLFVDIAGRITELGRQPRSFAQLVDRFPDRVVLGTDLYPVTNSKFEKYFHFLESSDEGFDYLPREPYPPHPRSTMSAMGFSADILEGIYSSNAKRWLGSPAA
jgi:predicted TIM-barrel fold metal-dependent hydrolase